MAYPAPLEALVDAFERFPGIGRKSAERLAFHVLRDPSARELAPALERAVRETRRCSLCLNVTEEDPCPICSNEERDTTLLCVVEEPRHVEALERSGSYRGLYHVLMGSWNPADGEASDPRALEALIERSRDPGLRELILATDPDAEGEATAAQILAALDRNAHKDLVVSRLARGLPAGSAIEYLHRGVLEDALEGRRQVRIGVR